MHSSSSPHTHARAPTRGELQRPIVEEKTLAIPEPNGIFQFVGGIEVLTLKALFHLREVVNSDITCS